MNERKLRQLTELSKEARQLLTKMIGQIGVGHVGGSLSLIEALVYLYYEEMRVRPEEPGWPDRDRIVLSKGHAGPALYTLLAMKGYFDKEILLTLNQPGTRLPSHCDMKLTTGIDMTAGSLGQGLSAAVGMALAARMERKDYRVYCIVGDGEQQEGQIWEAAMYAGSQEARSSSCWWTTTGCRSTTTPTRSTPCVRSTSVGKRSAGRPCASTGTTSRIPSKPR